VSTPPPQDGGQRPDLFARFQSAVPLLVVYFAFAAIYAWEASRRPVPTIFTDELELTQLARSIADTGEPARRGVPYDGFASLAAYVLAPVWWLGSASSAYATGKLVLVLAMTATLFPAYGLARMVVPRWYALGAAAAAVAVPALTYAPFLVEEPLAYPLSTLALWLVARLLARPSWGGLAAAAAAAALGAFARTQLAVLFAVLALGLLWLAWESEPGRRWRSGWTRWDWAGAVALAIGAALVFSATMGHFSTSWRNTTFIYKGRILDHATWAMGALAIGIGVLPLMIGLAALARPKSEARDPQTRAFVVTAAAALAAFVWYAGIKGAYLSTVFATYVYERNVIYLAPVLFVAMALALARGIGRAWAIALAAVVTVYVVNAVPVVLQYPYYEAHGLAALAFANRELAWPAGRIDSALLVLSLVAVALAIVLRALRPGSKALTVFATAAGVVVVSWSMTTQVYAAAGERTLSRQVAHNLSTPYNWVDRATGGKSVVVLGQQISDPTGVWLTEFFNRSVKKIWSLDGSAANVGGPILTPDLDATDGTLTPSPETDYALGVNGVHIQAPIVDQRGTSVLYRLDGQPIMLKDALIGRQSDGWMVANRGEKVARASYTRYDVAGDGPGFALVKFSRVGWCPSPSKRSPGIATVKIGPVGIGPDKQPAIARVTESHRVVVKDCITTPVLLRPPNGPWRVEISLTPTFVPKDVDPSESDNRELGAVLDAGFQPLFD
jgi:hypothetical protein